MISTIETKSPASIALIEAEASNFARARTALADQLAELQAELEAAKKRHMRTIKKLALDSAQAEASLRASIEQAPHLFERPRTLTLHGIKVGYRTSQGRIAWDDEETVLKLIGKHLKDQADTLTRTKVSINKDALKTLTAPELPRIGCRLENAGDQVVLAAADDEIEKMLSKLISDMVETILDEKP